MDMIIGLAVIQKQNLIINTEMKLALGVCRKTPKYA